MSVFQTDTFTQVAKTVKIQSYHRHRAGYYWHPYLYVKNTQCNNIVLARDIERDKT